MYYFRYLRPITLFLLSFFANLTRQVDIIIMTHFIPSAHAIVEPGLDMTSTCPDISPGICCRAPTIWLQHYGTITFHGLEALDFAAIWRERYVDNVAPDGDQVLPILGCSGRVMETRQGPGTWIWTPGPLDDVASSEGASFFRIPAKLPPDPSTNKWMMVEGLVGLAWGGGNWFISEKAKRVLGGGRMKGRRDIRSKEKGNMWARAPMRECFPKWIDVNGTRYEDEGTEGKVYKGGSGEMLNTTTWFDRN